MTSVTQNIDMENIMETIYVTCVALSIADRFHHVHCISTIV